MQKGRQRGAAGVRIKSSSYTRTSGGTVIFPGGVPGELADFEPSPASPSAPFHGSGSARAAVDGREANVRLIGSRVGTLLEAVAVLTRPLGDRMRRGVPESSKPLPAAPGEQPHSLSNIAHHILRCRGRMCATMGAGRTFRCILFSPLTGGSPHPRNTPNYCIVGITPL